MTSFSLNSSGRSKNTKKMKQHVIIRAELSLTQIQGEKKNQYNLKTTTSPLFGIYPKEMMILTERCNKDVHYNLIDSSKKKKIKRSANAQQN